METFITYIMTDNETIAIPLENQKRVIFDGFQENQMDFKLKVEDLIPAKPKGLMKSASTVIDKGCHIDFPYSGNNDDKYIALSDTEDTLHITCQNNKYIIESSKLYQLDEVDGPANYLLGKSYSSPPPSQVSPPSFSSPPAWSPQPPLSPPPPPLSPPPPMVYYSPPPAPEEDPDRIKNWIYPPPNSDYWWANQ